MQNDNLIMEQESVDIKSDTCAFSMPSGTMNKTINGTTYVVNLYFKDKGQTFSEKLKRVLKAEVTGAQDLANKPL